MTSDPRYPDLIGKAAIVAGQGTTVIDVVNALAANRVLIAIVAADRDIVRAATAAAEAHDVAVMGMTTDPASPETWQRITQHIEQRLGPIDIAVSIGPAEVHDSVRGALVRDMLARHRGVLVAINEAGPATPLGDGVRHFRIGLTDAAEVARYASDLTPAG